MSHSHPLWRWLLVGFSVLTISGTSATMVSADSRPTLTPQTHQSLKHFNQHHFDNQLHVFMPPKGQSHESVDQQAAQYFNHHVRNPHHMLLFVDPHRHDYQLIVGSKLGPKFQHIPSDKVFTPQMNQQLKHHRYNQFVQSFIAQSGPMIPPSKPLTSAQIKHQRKEAHKHEQMTQMLTVMSIILSILLFLWFLIWWIIRRIKHPDAKPLLKIWFGWIPRLFKRHKKPDWEPMPMKNYNRDYYHEDYPTDKLIPKDRNWTPEQKKKYRKEHPLIVLQGRK